MLKKPEMQYTKHLTKLIAKNSWEAFSPQTISATVVKTGASTTREVRRASRSSSKPPHHACYTVYPSFSRFKQLLMFIGYCSLHRMHWNYDDLFSGNKVVILSRKERFCYFTNKNPGVTYRNVSRQEQSFSGLQSPRWSFSIKVFY